MDPVLFVARFLSPRLVNKISKNRQFASCAAPLKSIGLVAVTGLVGAVNFALQPGGGKQVRERSFCMEAPADSLQGKNMGAPDEVRSFDKGRMDVVTLDNVTVGKATYRAGMALVGGGEAYCGY